jgi:monoterpene epsilon-lactone hydrolase
VADGVGLIVTGTSGLRVAASRDVEVRFDVFAEMFHSFQMMAGRAPEADDAIRRFAEWVGPKLGLRGEG